MDDTLVRNVVAEVMQRLKSAQTTPAPPAPSAAPAPSAVPMATPRAVSSGPRFGLYDDVDAAAQAAHEAHMQLRKHGIEGRAKVIEIVKTMAVAKAVEWGKLEFAETKIGRLEHKVEKLQIIPGVPGTEWIQPRGMSGDNGITMEEFTPIGVVGAITPVTHSVPTLSGNIINIVAAGNGIVFNAHPGGAKCAATAVKAYNEAIHAELGISELITIIESPTIESFNQITQQPLIGLLCVTGGPGVVRAALRSGKRAICAGPGNPPVVVDETVDLDKAAAAILTGGGYDNNLLCIGEKQVFVPDSIFTAFMAALKRNGGAEVNAAQLDRLTDIVFTTKEDSGGCSKPVLNRDMVGKDAAFLAERTGATVPADTQMLVAETAADHPFVEEEQMTSVLPIVRVRDVDEGIALAKHTEHGYKHSAMIHSLNVSRISKMAQELDTTLFVKNGPCVAGLGLGGEGYLSYSIATTTGEGITTPMTFTRTRRCVMVEHLRIW